MSSPPTRERNWIVASSDTTWKPLKGFHSERSTWLRSPPDHMDHIWKNHQQSVHVMCTSVKPKTFRHGARDKRRNLFSHIACRELHSHYVRLAAASVKAYVITIAEFLAPQICFRIKKKHTNVARTDKVIKTLQPRERLSVRYYER